MAATHIGAKHGQALDKNLNLNGHVEQIDNLVALEG
jgi:hypothetical protein